MVTGDDLLSCVAAISEAAGGAKDSAWEALHDLVRDNCDDIWPAVLRRLEQARDPATWTESERDTGEPKVVGDLQLVVWMLAQVDRRSLDAPVASARQDDLAASVLQDAFAPIDFFRLVGRECVASAWIKYQSDDKAWRWWSVPLVTELMSDVDDGGLDIDEAWDLCRFLAEQCEVPDYTGEEVGPLSMVGVSPLEDLFRRDSRRFLAFVERDAPTSPKLRRALWSTWPAGNSRDDWMTLGRLVGRPD